jgi:hypothetical protein
VADVGGSGRVPAVAVRVVEHQLRAVQRELPQTQDRGAVGQVLLGEVEGAVVELQPHAEVRVRLGEDGDVLRTRLVGVRIRPAGTRETTSTRSPPTRATRSVIGATVATRCSTGSATTSSVASSSASVSVEVTSTEPSSPVSAPPQGAGSPDVIPQPATSTAMPNDATVRVHRIVRRTVAPVLAKGSQ